MSTRANNTTDTKIVGSHSDLSNTVNDEVPAKTARPLETNDQSYDVTKWVSFAGKQVLFLCDIHNCIQEIINLIYISYILFYLYQLVQDKSSSLKKRRFSFE